MSIIALTDELMFAPTNMSKIVPCYKQPCIIKTIVFQEAVVLALLCVACAITLAPIYCI